MARLFDADHTDQAAVLATIRAVRDPNPEVTRTALLHLDQGERFDALLVAASRHRGELRLWATIVVHTRAMRTRPAVYAVDAISPERVAAAAAGLHRAISGDADLIAAGQALASLLRVVSLVLAATDGAERLSAQFAADRARILEDLASMPAAVAAHLAG